ncbi:myosin 2 [Sugiyamaella lignohabitans]|uniref:Myosin 2 n=1 Tax=Sugiyamaella lignohabitans TaxID=796027 RepID=A0A161HJE1_9ASCO|nr:myosin 2 [Sugiyamaella lignohabitans]ANB12827.1 myosin 2 [Sugiyamaella lignohabitans]
MLRDKSNQTIVVSGESGAGKTVSAKYIMRYFATVEDPDHPRKIAKGHSHHNNEALSQTEEQILATNPIMEAFGNAKTTRNDNSSRFGKYLEIQFDKNVDIIGARIRTYLLERSRLVFQPATERNYHIFYQLCSGATDEERQQFKLLPVEEFDYLNQGGEPAIQNVDDAAEFSLTREALTTIGVDSTVQHDIFKILAALLYIGNIKVTATRTNAVLNSDEPALTQVCELLGLDAVNFAKWITKKQIITRSEKIVSNLNHKQATVVRDSVAKYIYSTLFDWLVTVINQGLLADESKHQVNSFIGVLDIYGFEHFKINSFEQFCINYANEKLQQEFNQHVFKLEQDEYVREEIEWTFIDFSDNQPCISLIEAKMGILSLLDEESRLPAGSDEGWVGKLYQNFDNAEHSKFFKKPRFGKSSFIVSHYAMDVAYEVEGFIEKNRDTVPDELIEVLNATSNEFLKQVLETKSAAAAAPAAASSSSAPGRAVVRKPTLGSIFKGSLIELMTTINSTNVHYIRCIKPNDDKAAWKFNGPMVLSQLRACGVLETIRISCAGFPTRWTYEEFASRYYMLVPSTNWSVAVKELCDVILQQSIQSPDKYQLGKTKIFFRAGMLAYLEKLRSDRLNECAIVIQKNLRMLHFRKQYLATRQSIIAAQTLIRGFIARKRYENERREAAATVIQTRWRGYTARTSYSQTRTSIIALQRMVRGYMLRRRLLQARYDSAAITIQKVWRGHVARKEYHATRNKIILVQGLVRRRAAIKELKQLRLEAKSVNHYKEVQYRLENKVVELTQSLATRREDNKKLQSTIDGLHNQISQWQRKHGESEQRLVDYSNESDETRQQLLREIDTIKANLASVQKEHDHIVAKLQSQVEENKRVREELEAKELALSESAKTVKEYEEKHASLNETISQLRIDLENAIKAQPSTFAPSLTPLRSLGGVLNGGNNLNTASPKKRNPKRRSLTNALGGAAAGALAGGAFDEAAGFSPRPASIAIPNSNELHHHGRQYSASTEISIGSIGLNGEIERLLEDEKVLHTEVIQGMIFNLKIPAPSSNEKITPKEILFPANIINLITSEMWRLGFVKESERFLGQAMHAIQDSVMKHTGEDVINPGAFWISNVHEILSFICLAEANIVQNEALLDEMGEFEFQEYGRLVGIVKQDLENLEFNIYHTWMKEIKKVLDKMIVPAIVMSQSLPGFITQENTRFLSKMFTGSGNTATMDDLLSLFNKVHKAMDAYYLEPEFVKQPIMELLKLVGVKAFNDLLMRRAFLSWKRGLQINYNITRIEEWCKAHDVAEGILRLEHIMQSVKLLQLKKSTMEDIDIIYDICWTLTPAQVQKLINQYLVADYEPPISAEILNAVASRVKNDNNNTLLLEAIPLDDSGPFEIMEPRVLKRIESYIPGWLQVPNLKRLAELTATVNQAAINGDESQQIQQQQLPSQDITDGTSLSDAGMLSEPPNDGYPIAA